MEGMMSKQDNELKIARIAYDKRLRSVQRIEYHLERIALSENDDDLESAAVALRIAQAEVVSSEHQLNVLVAEIREQNKKHSNVSILHTSAHQDNEYERDHFSEAVDLVDPQLRLQLAK